MSSARTIIAVVDDMAPVRATLGRLLRLADYEVESFASGEEFLLSLDTHLPGCVILDVHMPGLSGFDVHQSLRATGARVPVVFITASDEVSLDRRARDAGAAALLRKPFSNAELLQAIDKALEAADGLV